MLRICILTTVKQCPLPVLHHGTRSRQQGELHVGTSVSVRMKVETDRLTLAVMVLEQFTGQTPALSKVRYTVMSSGIRKNEKVVVYYTSTGPRQKKSWRKT